MLSTLYRVVLLLSIYHISACSMLKLQQDMTALGQMGNISGKVELDIKTKQALQQKQAGQLIFGLYKENFGNENLIDIHISLDGDFDFQAFPGDYYVAVSHDQNGDFSAQAGEVFGYTPKVIQLRAKQKITDISLQLSTIYTKEQAAKIREEEKNAIYTNLWKGLLNIGAVVTLDDQRFSAQNAYKSLWQPLEFSLETGPGIYFLEEYDPNKIPILFVHGIGGSPRNWQTLVKHIDRDKFQPWFFQYETGFPLSYSAYYLSETMKELKRKHGFKQLYLIAHSMGGLVAKGYINHYQQQQEDYITLFITLATPWEGHAAAELGSKYAPVTIPVWHDMKPGSDYLNQLWQEELIVSMDYHLYFGFRGNSMLTPGCDDGSVSLASQLKASAQSRANIVKGFNVDHTEILRSEEIIRIIDKL